MKKDRLKKVLLAVLILIILALVGIYFLLQRQTYNTIETVEYYENVSADNPGYVEYLDGIIKYTRDGVAFLDKSGNEIWNQPCQMGNPTIEMRGEIIAVCDRGGTSIFVFEEEGLKGEIQTTRPIERISVSEQGIVAVILKDDETPMIMCYDATGNTLVEQSASLDNTGYPMDVAISNDGNVLLVSYLLAQGNGVATRIVYYDFSSEDIDKVNYQIYEKEYADVVIPVVDYLDKDTSILVADDSVILYEGKNELEETASFELDTICNISYTDRRIAVLVKDSEKSEYKLQMYDLNGEMDSEILLDREYHEIKICGNQIILYESNMCSIYTKDGICKYQGEVDMPVLEIFPLVGLNKYMMINANGFYEVRLAK